MGKKPLDIPALRDLVARWENPGIGFTDENRLTESVPDLIDALESARGDTAKAAARWISDRIGGSLTLTRSDVLALCDELEDGTWLRKETP